MSKHKKTRDIKLRFTLDEYNEVWRRKEAHGLSFTDYGRYTMLGPNASRKFPNRKMLAAILVELGKLNAVVSNYVQATECNLKVKYMTDHDFKKLSQNIAVIRDYIAKAVRL